MRTISNPQGLSSGAPSTRTGIGNARDVDREMPLSAIQPLPAQSSSIGLLEAMLYGLGTDGVFVLDGVNDYPGVIDRVGSVYTPARNIYASNLTIKSGITLKRVGFQVYVSDTYFNDGIDSNNGGDALLDAPAEPAGYGIAGFYDIGSLSAAGVTGADGVAGSADTATPMGNGSGAGGASLSHVGGVASGPLDHSHSPQTFPGIVVAFRTEHNTGYPNGGAYGGSGAGEDGPSGAGGGSPGILFIAARHMRGSGSLQSRGGKGGNATAASNSGGGGGGGGGCIILISGDFSLTLTLDVSGGAGGAKDGTGSPGLPGVTGRVLRFT